MIACVGYDRAIDFYGTTAQIIPVLLLALVWDSGYLRELAGKSSADLVHRKIWTKPHIRIWGLFMSAAAVAGEAATLLVLAEIVDDGAIPKAIVLVGIAALLGSMCTRLAVDIVNATKEPPTGGEQPADRQPPT